MSGFKDQGHPVGLNLGISLAALNEISNFLLLSMDVNRATLTDDLKCKLWDSFTVMHGSLRTPAHEIEHQLHLRAKGLR